MGGKAKLGSFVELEVIVFGVLGFNGTGDCELDFVAVQNFKLTGENIVLRVKRLELSNRV